MSYHSATLGIMSSDTFKNRTQATRAVCGVTARFKSRGSNMDSIDEALYRWERNCNQPTVNAFHKTAMLMIIERECAAWLQRKRDKSSRLANFRKGTIETLMIDAKKAAAYMRNKYYTEQKSQSQAHTQGGGRIMTKSLDGAYKLERQDYLGRGKAENPHAAGDIDPLRDGKSLDQMNLQEFANSGAARVYYHDRAERMQYLTYIEGGFFFDGAEKANTKVQDIWGVQSALASMYAVDKYGNMFTKDVNGFDGTFFNHSSFCAGKEVICAGTAVFCDGELRYISTNSGHYKPAPPQLRLFLTSLASEDVDLTNVCVFIKTPAGDRFLRANTFMANMTAATDWPNMDAKGQPVISMGGVQASATEPKG